MSSLIVAQNVDLDDGIYNAKWGGWMMLIDGRFFKTDVGIRGEAVEFKVKVESRTMYTIDKNDT